MPKTKPKAKFKTREIPEGSLLTPQFKGPLPPKCGISRCVGGAPCTEGRRRLALYVTYDGGTFVRDASGLYFAIEAADCGASCFCDAVATLLPPCVHCGVCLWASPSHAGVWRDYAGSCTCETVDPDLFAKHEPMTFAQMSKSKQAQKVLVIA